MELWNYAGIWTFYDGIWTDLSINLMEILPIDPVGVNPNNYTAGGSMDGWLVVIVVVVQDPRIWC